MAPRPKIPPEYAKVAEKLSSEAPNIAGEFSSTLDDLAKGLSDNLESRSVPTADAIKSTAPAAIFDKSVNTASPVVRNPTDFNVGLDELLGKFGTEPKEVTGTGRMERVLNKDYPMVTDKYKEGTGVLMDKGAYTPNRTEPSSSSYPRFPPQGANITANVRQENALINDHIMEREVWDSKNRGVFVNNLENNDPGHWDGTNYVENIPAVVGGAIGAGVLLSSQNAEAKELPLEQELQTDNVATEPKISLTQQVKNTVRDRKTLVPLKYEEDGMVTENGNTSTVLDELQNLGTALKERAKHNLTTFAKDVGEAYTQYHAEKDALNIRAQQMLNTMEANGQHISDDDRELLTAELGVKAGSPVVSAVSDAEGIVATISKFNREVLQPIKGVIRSAEHSLVDGRREFEQKHAPSIAVLNDTLAFPLLGNTGWNVKPDSIGITDSADDMEKGMSQLEPEVRKLFDDKTALLGTYAGKAMFVFANKFADLPLWIIGGSSKAALMLGGAANEVMSDDKEANPARGMAFGLIGGKTIEHVVSPVVSKGLSLLGKVKLDSSGVMDAFGKVTFDDNAEHIKKAWKALVGKNTIDPMLMMTGKGATLMADNAALKVRPDVSEAMNTQVIAPQAFVLGIEPETGKPKLYGVKDGLYGELNDFVNPEGRPVLINQIAKDEWMQNSELRDAWNKLIDPKRKTPATTKHGIDEWTPDVIPPENPALIYAWKQFADGKGAAELYRGGSREFTKDFLRSRELVRVEFTGPDGRPTTGLGFWGAGGDVVFAPEANDCIPGAIPKDLTFKQVRMNPNVPASGIPDQNQAWEIHQLTDEHMYNLVDEIKATQTLQRDAATEAARGGTLDDGVPALDKRPPNEFDIDMNAAGPALAMAGGALADNPTVAAAVTAAALAFLPPAKRAIGKALTKVNNAAGKLGLIGDTVYGELFKIDASIQAFSLRHYKRLTEDLNKQLINSFKDAAQTPLQREQFNNQLKYYIENHQANKPAPLPPQLQPAIQQKVQKYVAERNYEWALIEQLGGTVPDKTPTGNAELERMFALDYFREGEAGYEKEARWRQFYNHVTGNYTTDNQWIERMKRQQPQSNGIINLLVTKEASKNVAKTTRAYDQIMGRMSTEMEMSTDYMNRKLQLNQLAFMSELAKNTQASSPTANQALGHVRQVTSNSSGMLKGKYVSDETFKAIFTYPEDQKMLQNTMLGVVNMIKFNKTVLNPTTWVKNIMGNVWGVMNSNIVSSWNMTHRIPLGIRQMSRDLAKFNADVMANDPAVHRVHETLKYGLLGAEFESSRTKMLDVLDNLAEPIAQTSNRSWGEKIANGYFLAKDATLGSMAHVYSKVDMATKYSLYVNGLERWGIDLGTNSLRGGIKGRKMASDLLGASVANNFQITDDVLTDMIKREVVRRIHLSLPMVDRIGPVATGLNKLSPITSPWLRTASELTRSTLQMPYRMFNEKGYAVNALKTASFLGTILGVNKALRLREGISDEVVDDAKRIAPPNITNYMPGATATQFYVGEGNDRGIVALDMAGGLVEPLQWFKGGDVSNGADAAKRIGANGIDLIMGGGIMDKESKDAQAAFGLTDTAQNFGTPFWKQFDTLRYVKQKAIDAGPAFVNSGWRIYSTQSLPNGKGTSGLDKLEQPLSMQLLKFAGIPVATMGTAKQKEYKIAELEARQSDMIKKGAFADLQTEGSDTGPLQKPYNAKEVEAKYDAEVKRLDEQIKQLKQSKAVGKTDKGKIDLLNMDNMLTPHL